MHEICNHIYKKYISSVSQVQHLRLVVGQMQHLPISICQSNATAYICVEQVQQSPFFVSQMQQLRFVACQSSATLYSGCRSIATPPIQE